MALITVTDKQLKELLEKAFEAGSEATRYDEYGYSKDFDFLTWAQKDPDILDIFSSNGIIL